MVADITFVLTLEDTDYVCDYIGTAAQTRVLDRIQRRAFARVRSGRAPANGGVANQTTMLRGETEEVQRRVRRAIVDRDGPELAERNFRFSTTICGATQERQDALRELLDVPMDLCLVVGGYNSSNTSHLAEMGEEKLPTYFVLNASRLVSATEISTQLARKTRSGFRISGCRTDRLLSASLPAHRVRTI